MTDYIIFAKYADPVPVRVMARADGYVMVAAEAGLPFVVTERDLELGAMVKGASEECAFRDRLVAAIEALPSTTVAPEGRTSLGAPHWVGRAEVLALLRESC